VSLGKTAKDEEVVYVYKIEIQDFEDLIHEMLEVLDGVT
jgi:NurA-like 5'-3' nuclease